MQNGIRCKIQSIDNYVLSHPGVEGAPLKKSGVGGLLEKSVNLLDLDHLVAVAAAPGSVDDNGCG